MPNVQLTRTTLGNPTQMSGQWLSSVPFSIASGFEKEVLLRSFLPARKSDLPLFLLDDNLPDPVKQLAMAVLAGDVIPKSEADYYREEAKG